MFQTDRGENRSFLYYKSGCEGTPRGQWSEKKITFKKFGGLKTSLKFTFTNPIRL